MKQPATFLYEQDAQGIATITLNRPERLNAVNPRLADELPEAVDAAARDDAVGGAQVRRREAYRPAALVPAHDAPLDAVRPPQHPAREVDRARGQQFADAA